MAMPSGASVSRRTVARGGCAWEAAKCGVQAAPREVLRSARDAGALAHGVARLAGVPGLGDDDDPSKSAARRGAWTDDEESMHAGALACAVTHFSTSVQSREAATVPW